MGATHDGIIVATDERRVSRTASRRYGPAPFETDWTCVPDIFDEVEEDLRAERARKLAQRYGGLGVGVLVLILVVTGGYVWWQQRQAEAANAVAARFIAAQKTADASAGALGNQDRAQEDEASRALAALAGNSPAGYQALALLRLAALQWQMGDKGKAIDSWATLTADQSAPQLLRDLSTLTSGQHQVDSGDPAQVKQQLMTLTASDNRWRPMAEQSIALLDLRMGKPAEAAAIMQRLSTDPGVPQGIREMAADLLTTIEVPPSATPTAAASSVAPTTPAVAAPAAPKK